ncbi:hypothetical protein AYI87_04655 [Shewanella sp. KCT]|nr:hypothetical protein AYI87_04655 [Shewanella sp. KCT]
MAFLVDLFDARLKKEGIDAAGLADKLILELAFYGGGRDFYVPNGARLKAALKAIHIYREFNGRNTNELAFKYCFTSRRIDQIIQEQRAIHSKANLKS